MAEKGKVKIACGPLDNGYVGVAEPELEVVFLQTDGEEARYKPIMAELVENGLATEGMTISGI